MISVPPKQYTILLNKVVNIVFALPGYTWNLFPKTKLFTLPTICDSSFSCTKAMQNALSELEKEFDAKVLALWSNSPPILLTKDKPVRTLEVLKG